ELRANRPRQALSGLESMVREAPEELSNRSRLFQVLCILGEWDRAETQLQVLPELDKADGELMMAAPAYLNLIQCERFRIEVFDGKRTPLILGEPEEWLGLLLEALRALTQGKAEAAAALRDRAFETAPGTSGQMDGESFEWIADADPRLGPVVELMLG